LTMFWQSLSASDAGCVSSMAGPVEQHSSNVCVTPVTYFTLSTHAPSGTPCRCATPYGPSAGRVQ
jgi:hypothetical protein